MSGNSWEALDTNTDRFNHSPKNIKDIPYVLESFYMPENKFYTSKFDVLKQWLAKLFQEWF